MSTDQTSNLGLPFLMPAQAQKHVTVNESLLRLDALVQARVQSRSVSSQPGSPGDGQLWIVPAGKTGAAWGGYADWALAHYRDGAWEPLTPRAGWRAWVADEGRFVRYAGSAWTDDEVVASLNGGPLAGFRNRIRNGGMDVRQRGNGPFAGDAYGVDGWLGFSVTTHQAAADAHAGFTHALEIGRSTAGYPVAEHRIEAADVRDLAGLTCVFSCWIKRVSGSGNLGCNLHTADAVDNFATNSYRASPFYVTPTSAWVRYSGSFTMPSQATNGVSLRLYADNTAMTFRVAGAQLEVGSVATPFERRPLALELALCQRFFEKSYAVPSAPGAVSAAGAEFGVTAGAAWHHGVRFKVPKRAAPSVTIYNPSTGATGSWRDVSASADRTTTADTIGENGFRAVLASTVSGNGFWGHWTASAEL